MTDSPLPSDYPDFLVSIKEQIRKSQLSALVSVNRELITMNWRIGKMILERQDREGWGSSVIERLSADLRSAFPNMKSFSPRYLNYMRAFAAAYPDEEILHTLCAEISWSHNKVILDKIKDPEERKWYIQKSAENGWSHNILTMQIESDLYNRSGKAITNFTQTLPALDSDMARDVLKDPYVFDFITTNDDTKERDVQAALITHVERFLLELGIGFTFVGSNYHLEVGDQDYYIDMLFYHLRLRCYVVIELKTGEFKPEYAGKLGFYLAAVDKQVKSPEDAPTIGIILCKGKNEVTAEYALSNINRPVGVAEYKTTAALPDQLKNQLPDITVLEKSLEDYDEKLF